MLVVVDTSVWIAYFRGQARGETSYTFWISRAQLCLKASEEITCSSTVGIDSPSCRLRSFPLTELA